MRKGVIFVIIILIIGLFVFIGNVSAATINAASCSQSAVQAAVNSASDGDTILIPDGSCTWTSGISTTKQIMIRAQNYISTKGGDSSGSQKVVITDNSPVPLFDLTSGDDYHVGIAGIRFNEGTGDGNHIRLQGTGSKVPLVNDCYFQVKQKNGDQPDIAEFAILSQGAVIWNCYWSGDAFPGSDGVGPDGATILVNSPRSWYTPSTMGNLDTNGNINVYIEDSTFSNIGQAPDVDDNGRFVMRHSIIDGTSGLTHGFTSIHGGRHVEYYDNVFSVKSSERNIAARYFWIRGGTGVFTDNVVNDASNPSAYGHPVLLDIGDNTAPGTYPMSRQPGYGYDGTSDVSDPIYIWDNTGSRADAFSFRNGWDSLVHVNRDIFVNNGPKPGYSKYTYPHPARSAAEGSAGASYYVDFASGSDSNSGTSAASPWKHCPGDTNYAGSGNLVPGDTVYFKRGITYSGMISTVSDGVTYTITDWGTGNATLDGSGRDAVFRVMHNDIVIDGGKNKNMVITGNTNHAAIWSYNDDHGLSGSVFTNLIIKDIGSSSSGEGIGIKIGGNPYAYTDYVISNNMISNCYSSAIKISGSGTGSIDIYNNIIENSGDKYGEDTQINLSSSDGQGVQNVAVHDNTIRNGAGNANGININNANNDIYNNEIYGNGGSGISGDPDYNTNYEGVLRIYKNKIHDNSAYGIIMGGSDNLRHTRVYDNVFYNDQGITEINLLGGASFNEIFSNTVYHSGAGSGIRVQSGSTGNNIKNNIVWVSNGYVLYDSTGNIIEDYNIFYRASGVDTVVWNNDLYSNIDDYRSVSGQGQDSLWADPVFVSPASDLFLQQTSPAIDKGTILSAYFTTDFAGTTRPQGASWDIGAYEFIQETDSRCGPADENSDGVVSTDELIGYISEWKNGSVTIGELITAIDKWKSGC